MLSSKLDCYIYNLTNNTTEKKIYITAMFITQFYALSRISHKMIHDSNDQHHLPHCRLGYWAAPWPE